MTAPLAQLESPRYEIKMLSRDNAHSTVLFLLQTHGSGIRIHHPSRRVQSIYFDTADGRAVRQNLSGQAEREKLRLRWYGDAVDRVEGSLELKIRRNALISKKRHALPEAVAVTGATRRSLTRGIMDLCPQEWRAIFADGLEPAQWISYDRRYYVTYDGTVRVTVDENVRAWDLRDSFVMSARYEMPLSAPVIVECKAAPEHYDQLQDVLNGLPLPRDKCSKYVMACCPGHFYV